jgi:hypothetical protein
VGKEFGVRRKEPGPSIGIKNPMSPAPGIAEFGLERLTVGSVIDKFRRRIVLTGRGYQLEAGAKNGLLPPFAELLNTHRAAAYQVDGKPQCYGQETGAVRQRLSTNDMTMEISNPIGQRHEETSGAAEEVK